MGSCGGGDSEGSQNFRRTGGSRTTDARALPTFLESLLRNNAEKGDISASLGGAQNTFLEGLLNKDYTQPEGKSTLEANRNIDPTGFPGASAVGAIASVNPYGSGFTSELDALYDDIFRSASATARTGPDAVRGGAAHGAMVESNLLEKAALDKFREVSQLQLAQADRTNTAAGVFANAENARRAIQMGSQNQMVQQILQGLGVGLGGSTSVNQRRGTNIGANESLANQLGTRTTTTRDDLKGKGNQESSHFGWQAGLNCCFTFIEALDGELPWYVRRGRDVLGTKEMRDGYVWMSKWLVPLMQKSKLAKVFVKAVLVGPFLATGKWWFGAGGSPFWGRLAAPICSMYCNLWSFIGRRLK